MAVPVSELQSVAPSAIIELFQLQLNTAQHGVNETHYFHSGSNLNASGDIIWAGQAYQRWPIEATGFEYSGGQLPRPTLRVINVMGTITALILTLPNGLEGAKVSRLRTLGRYLDGANFPGGVNPLGTPDPTAEWPREVFYIDRKSTENIEVVEFEMCAIFDLAGVRAPKRQCISNICQWKYRGPECGYVGNAYYDANDNPVGTLAQDVCGKRLTSCENRFQQLRINGSVTVGSNVISLAQPVSLSTGDPVSGFGIQAGTTVISTNGNLVTISQESWLSTSAVSAGTIQGDYASIALASAAGITAGMSVTGPYLPPNSQVVGISGNTVFLSSPVDVTQFFSAVSSASGTTGGAFVQFADGTPLTVWRFAASSVMPLARRCQVIGVRRVRGIDSGKNPRVRHYAYADLNQRTDKALTTTWTFYVETGIPSGTYTFSATNQTYTFRADSTLPYGSFPGVGTFFT
jgi:lambda family phage minor tail protein L